MKKVLALLFTFMIVLFSCKKDPEPAPEKPPQSCTIYTTHPLNDSMKPYMFKTGSYWIFENDSTAMLDSLAVTSTTFKYKPGITHYKQHCADYQHETYIMDIKSFTFSTTYDDCLFENYIKRNAAAGVSIIYGQLIFFNSSNVGAANNGVTVAEIIPSMVAGGNTFKNVRKMKLDPVGFPAQFKDTTYLYYCDSIGIIKKVIGLDSNQAESWGLKRWKVIL